MKSCYGMMGELEVFCFVVLVFKECCWIGDGRVEYFHCSLGKLD